MQIESCLDCKKQFQSKPAPCPDGRVGCLVAHYDKASFICPYCSFDMGPAVGNALLNGQHIIEPGIAIINVASIVKLNLFDEVKTMEKLGVQLDPNKTKTASDGKQTCPRCGAELEKDSGGAYINKCPTHGTEPFEAK